MQYSSHLFASLIKCNASHLQTGKRLSVLRGHTRPIKCMLLLHQRQEFQNEEIAATLLLTGSSDRTILVSLSVVAWSTQIQYG